MLRDATSGLFSDSGSLQVPNTPAHSFSGPFSISLHVKLPGLLAVAVPLVEKAGEYIVRLTVAQELQAEIYTGGSNFLQVTTTGTVGLEAGHSVTVTWNGGTASDGLTLYVDGVADGALVASDVGTYTAMPVTASPTNLGNEGIVYADDCYFNDISIW